MKTLLQVLQETFPDSSIPENVELGIGAFPEWDSLGHFNLMMLAEGEYGVRFTVDEMNECKSLLSLRELLEKHGVRVVVS